MCVCVCPSVECVFFVRFSFCFGAFHASSACLTLLTQPQLPLLHFMFHFYGKRARWSDDGIHDYIQKASPATPYVFFRGSSIVFFLLFVFVFVRRSATVVVAMKARKENRKIYPSWSYREENKRVCRAAGLRIERARGREREKQREREGNRNKDTRRIVRVCSLLRLMFSCSHLHYTLHQIAPSALFHHTL